ncbi:uncharacterized protein KIAA0825-like [Diadema setosum]|uniref:uncharacterized protein KIAA0825-like n=1 Tax=Diadema setosum TaxID=31175 RepID=UPI003B3B4CAE
MSRQCVLPSLTAMFQFGMPSMDNLETVIADIDEQLSHNDKKIEETLQKLVKATNSLSLDNNYTNIKDAMDSLIQTPVLEECACLTPDAEDVNTLFKAILHHASSHPNSESLIFEQLLGLASHEGLGLPIRAPKPSYVAASTLSINTVGDSLEQENDTLWEDIRSKLKRHFLDKLRSTELPGPRVTPGPLSSMARAQRVEGLQSLCILYPIKEVWASYQTISADKVGVFLKDRLGGAAMEMDEPRPRATLRSLAETLGTLAPHFHAMLEEECALHVADVFEGEVSFLEAAHEIYLSRLKDDLQGRVEEAWVNLTRKDKSRAGPGGGASSNGSATKSIGASDWLKGDDDLVGREQGKKKSSEGDKILMTPEDLQDFIAIATALHNLSQHLSQLAQHATKDVGALFKSTSHGREHIRGVLKHNRDGGSAREIRMPSDYTGRGVLPEAIPPPFGVMPGMVGSDYSKHKSSLTLDTPTQQKNCWDWSSLLENFTSLVIRSITKLAEDGLKEECSREMERMKTEKKVNIVECGEFPGNPTQPYFTCQSVALACKFVNSVLPLVTTVTDKVLLPIRAAVVDVMVSSMQEIAQHLTKLLESYSQASEEQGANKDLCVLLSSTAWVLEELARYGRLLREEDAKRSLAGIEKQVGQLQTIIRQQVIASHITVISTVILHDAESHHWADQRPFFEDERCSYSVQMWHLYLERLRYEMFSFTPPAVAQDVFATIFSESLTQLSYRYSRAQPSYKRTQQFRSDITSILLSTLTHLWSASGTPLQLLSPPSLLSGSPHFPSDSAPLSIHNSATCLLAALGVVSSPLQDLYKVFKKGFQRKASASVQRGVSSGREGKDGNGNGNGNGLSDQRLWLAWIRPGLFDQLEQGWNLLPDKIASFILLKLLAHQPAPKHGLTLQTLLSRDALLASLMMSNTGGSLRYEVSTILQPLIDVLILCNDHPTALGTVLMAVIERQDNWPMFRYDSLPGKTTSVPDWLACLFTVLKPFITRGVCQAAEVLLKKRNVVEMTGFLETLGELPCGCRPKHRTAAASTFKQEKDTTFAALKLLLSCIAEDCIALPTPLKIFLYSLQEKLRENSIRSAHCCVCLQVIGSCVSAMLSDEAEVKRIVGDSIPDAGIKAFAQLGEYAFLSLTATSNHSTQEKLPNPLHTFTKLHSDWLQEQIDIIIDHLGNESLGQLTNYSWDETNLDYLEEYYALQADHVTRTTSGTIGLLKINKLFKNNLAWFQHHLDIPPVLPTGEPQSIPMFDPTATIPSFACTAPAVADPPATAPPSPPPFNPLIEFHRLDDAIFDHEAIAAFSYDWARLLQSHLGLSEAGFRSLLSHRHEMQEDACLEESERKPVRVLRSKFDLDKGDLV